MSSLSPFDLLSLDSTEQLVLRCLTKTPQLTVMDVSLTTGLPRVEVEAALHELLKAQKIIEQLQHGERVFSTRFKFQRKRVRNMPDEILNAFAQSPAQILAKSPFTADLSPDAVKELLALGEERALLANEVFAWQGEPLNCVAVIQQGLISSTRLKGNHVGQSVDYLHGGSWFGFAESFNASVLSVTYTAVTDSILMVWPIDKLMPFILQHGSFSIAIARQMSHALRACEKLQTQGQSKLWVVEGVHTGAGATTFAANLALLTQKQLGQSKSRTLFWPVEEEIPSWLRQSAVNGRTKTVGLAKIVPTENGLDVLTEVVANSYSPQVQLSVLLNDLHARYDTIICDTGSRIEDEFLLRLRGQAHTLLSLTQESDGAADVVQRWQSLQPYSNPGQKRVLTLNRCKLPATEADPQFHLLIPCDVEGMNNATQKQQSLIEFSNNSPFTEALLEVYRRLSLNHSVALFVPSTMDVDQSVDNRAQVQETLSFFGNLFGGATSSNAEGAWRSEDSGIVTEQVTIVKTFVSRKALDTYLDEVFSFASQLKVNMKQEAVAVSVDNRLILV